MLGSTTFAVPVSNGDSRLFQRILDTAPEAMVLADAQGTILLVNQQAGTMFRYRPEEMLGQKIEILLPERFRASHPHRRADFSAHPHQRIITASKELYGLRKDGSEFSIEVSLNPIEADHGILISSTIVDVSDRKLAEQTAESRWKDRERYKDEFLSHVSHELRSPLTAIKQFSTILLTGLAGDLNQVQREYQQIVQKNILQLQSMIDDLLEVTRLDTGKLSIDLESISVSDSVIDVVQSLQELARKKSVSISCDLPAGLPSVQADYTRLRQILIILIDNAVKFTPESGAVKIRARLVEDPQFLLIDVSDTGCGMSPETAGRVFERLYQASSDSPLSRKGLGLGLHICQELVTRQGGKIWVESKLTEGSTFSFTLPIVSLKTLIAPLLKNDRWPKESVSLIIVEMVWSSAWPNDESSKRLTREVRALVQRCLLPNLDVLLPKIVSGADDDRLFVVAFADENGASVMVDRIQQQSHRDAVLKAAKVTLAVSYRRLVPFHSGNSPVEYTLAALVTKIQEFMKSQIQSEVACHE